MYRELKLKLHVEMRVKLLIHYSKQVQIGELYYRIVMTLVGGQYLNIEQFYFLISIFIVCL